MDLDASKCCVALPCSGPQAGNCLILPSYPLAVFNNSAESISLTVEISAILRERGPRTLLESVVRFIARAFQRATDLSGDTLFRPNAIAGAGR